jgi:phosphoribosyl 1,2-cyclic phosphate phosphodiesterase
LFDREIIPIPLFHGSMPVFGFRIGKLAYLTDHNRIPEESMALLQGLDTLFLDALRYKPHPTHSTVAESLRIVDKLKPRMAYFTHICHDLGHQRAESMLPDNVRLAYDGLTVTVDA